jgi:hypothetical protein
MMLKYFVFVQELLLEHADLFYHFKSIAPEGTITQDDIKEITDALQDDSRQVLRNVNIAGACMFTLVEDSGLLECDSLLMGDWFKVFWNVTVCGWVIGFRDFKGF